MSAALPAKAAGPYTLAMTTWTTGTAPQAAAVAFITSLALVAGAHGFEAWGGLLPCDLCLRQREAHWTAMGLAALTLGAATRPAWRDWLAWPLAALVAVYLVSAGIAGYHVGVEWGVFELPESCGAGAEVSEDLTTEEFLMRLQSPVEAPACDQVAWSLFGLSLAGYNVIFSLALAALCAVAAWRQWSVGDRARIQSA